MEYICFMADYTNVVFYDMDDDEGWRGPVPVSDVPEGWRGKSPAMRMPDGELRRAQDLPPGAMWDYMKCPDESVREAYLDRAVSGSYLVCQLPGGHAWQIDGRASNCTMPEDDEHRCWVREGIPPIVTAGKEGNTCTAGAGSIQIPGWHGFLRNGKLVPA